MRLRGFSTLLPETRNRKNRRTDDTASAFHERDVIRVRAKLQLVRAKGSSDLDLLCARVRSRFINNIISIVPIYFISSVGVVSSRLHRDIYVSLSIARLAQPSSVVDEKSDSVVLEILSLTRETRDSPATEIRF